MFFLFWSMFNLIRAENLKKHSTTRATESLALDIRIRPHPPWPHCLCRTREKEDRFSISDRGIPPSSSAEGADWRPPLLKERSFSIPAVERPEASFSPVPRPLPPE